MPHARTTPGIACGDALATAGHGLQAQARESFGSAASGAPSQRVAVALFCGLAASMAASPGLGCQARRLVPDELHFLEERHLLYLFPRCRRWGTDLIASPASYVMDAGVADWRHDMENRAYRRDRLWIGSLKT